MSLVDAAMVAMFAAEVNDAVTVQAVATYGAKGALLYRVSLRLGVMV